MANNSLNNSLEELRMNKFYKGAWLMYDGKAKAEAKTTYMDKLAAECQAKHEDEHRERLAKEQAEYKRKHPNWQQEESLYKGSLMLLRDWESKFYHG